MTSLETIKKDLLSFNEKFHSEDSEDKVHYFQKYEPYLGDYYQTEDFPDNYEVRYSVDIFLVDENIYYFGFSFLLGDFNLGLGSQDNYTYERHINKETADYLYSRFLAVGLWNVTEPIKVEGLVDKLFPELKRDRISTYFNNEKREENT